MVSVNLTCDSFGFSKPLTASQEVLHHRRLNVPFELSIIIRLYKYLLFGNFLNS